MAHARREFEKALDNDKPRAEKALLMIQKLYGVSAYLYDGAMEIDNNLVENAIMPVSLGTKKCLFAASHDATQRSAMIYSFFVICKKHQLNPYKWLKYKLENIMSINHKSIKDLYPQNFKKIFG